MDVSLVSGRSLQKKYADLRRLLSKEVAEKPVYTILYTFPHFTFKKLFNLEEASAVCVASESIVRPGFIKAAINQI